jgi:hypothetical protein
MILSEFDLQNLKYCYFLKINIFYAKFAIFMLAVDENSKMGRRRKRIRRRRKVICSY